MTTHPNDTVAPGDRSEHHEVVVVGAGVAGIYQLYRLLQLDIDVTLVEGAADLGGTWYNNRYPGCRFDSESYTYGYSFSKEVLEEWNWSERFSGQPENLRYLNFIADKFDLRPHMQFDSRVESVVFDEAENLWTVALAGGRKLTCQFVVTCLGLLSTASLPNFPGVDTFAGPSFHAYNWPHDGIDLAEKRVAVVGTGATGVQIIAALAPVVGELTVFQRRPNWCAPLNNGPISAAEMDDIKAHYNDIFELCSQTPTGFMHMPDRRRLHDVPEHERLAMWERLYAEPGFGIWLENFRDTFVDEDANAELSAFIAGKIRSRVTDPAIAEKLIPKDHGFGFRRVPMETQYYEAYNRPNVHLIDIQESPVLEVTSRGIRTTEGDYDFDVIVYATGFNAVTGAYDGIDIRGVGGHLLREKWADGPVTYLGLAIHGFPNLLMVGGPQSASGASNLPRSLEVSVDWVSDFLSHLRERGYRRFEATPEAEAEWGAEVIAAYEKTLLRKVKSWLTGYNSNVEGKADGKLRHVVYNGGGPKYRRFISEVAADNYRGLVAE